MGERIIKVANLPEAANVCQQMLKEVWKSEGVSIAYVEMLPGSISLLHKHACFTELYYILSGQGKIFLDDKEFAVSEDTLVEVAPGVSHKLENVGSSILRHLVISNPPFDPNDVEVLNG